jgi:hypothetical protein
VNGVSTYLVVSKSGASSLEVEHAQPDHVILASLARTLIAAALPCGLLTDNCTHAYLDMPAIDGQANATRVPSFGM